MKRWNTLIEQSLLRPCGIGRYYRLVLSNCSYSTIVLFKPMCAAKFPCFKITLETSCATKNHLYGIVLVHWNVVLKNKNEKAHLVRILEKLAKLEILSALLTDHSCKARDQTNQCTSIILWQNNTLASGCDFWYSDECAPSAHCHPLISH